MNNNQKGFHLPLLALIIVLVGIGIVGWRVVVKNRPGERSFPYVPPSVQEAVKKEDPNTPPLKLKSIGFNLGTYDPVTNSSGEMKFVGYNLFSDQIWGDFGQQDPRTLDTTKKNPQPTYVLPLSVKVQALVDGEVVKITKLYSDDFSIMVAKDKTSSFIYETEHVVNPLVKEGDHVKGGQIIADVSPHGSPGPGYGILEIGILHPQNTQAGHLCPYKYLDDSIKADIQKKITAVHEGWNQYKGKQVYNLSKFVSPGCVTEDWVQG